MQLCKVIIIIANIIFFIKKSMDTLQKYGFYY